MTGEDPNYDHHADALAAMAAGEHPHEEPAEEASADETIPLAKPLAWDDSAGDATIDPAAVPTSTAAERAAQHRTKSREALGRQFKKTMVPLLLISGALLIILGAVVALFKPDGEGNRFLSPGGAKIVAGLSFPLGMLLLAGAWLFHRDVKDPD